MAYAMILACAFFAALSGSAPATVLAIGGMLYSDMVRIGYPPIAPPVFWQLPKRSWPHYPPRQ